MRENKKILKRKEKGITLIALVITVIVLLILAGVSIAMLTGENGILTQAQNAKNETEEAGVIEKIKLAIEQAKIKDSLDTIDFNNAIKEELQKEDFEANVISNNIIKVIHYKDNTYIVNTETGEVNIDIIPIYTVEQLAKIAEVCKSGTEQIININGIDYAFTPSSVYSLQNDIDLSSFCSEIENKSWSPIGRLNSEGNTNNAFSGIFLGNNHKIDNLYINNTIDSVAFGDGIGLFGLIKDYAVIDGLTVSGKIENNAKYVDVGGIVGTTSSYSNVSISNCCNKATVTNNVQSVSAGGIVGSSVSYANITISDSYNIGKIYGQTNAGGIVGNSKNISILNCYNLGETSALTSGGIIASFASNTDRTKTNLEVFNCYNNGNVIGQTYSGGIVGATINSVPFEICLIEIINCYNNADIEAQNGNSSGVIGRICDNYRTLISNVYNTGIITATNQETAIAYADNSDNDVSIKNAYYLDNVESGVKNILEDNTIKMTDSQLKEESFANLLNKNKNNSNLKNVLKMWKFNENSYPSFNDL